MENPATWTQAEWVVQEALRKAQIGRNEGRVGLSMTRQVTDALREAGLLDKNLPSLNVFSPPDEIPAERPRPLKVNGRPIPPEITNGSAADFARFCGETDPAVLAILDAEDD